MEKHFKSCGAERKIYNVRHAWTLKKLVRRVIRVHTGDNNGSQWG